MRAHDIALVELAEDVSNIVPATLNMGFDELGDTVSLVGYGPARPATQLDLEIVRRPEKIAGTNVIDSAYGVQVNGREDHLVFDFDSPYNRKVNMMGSPQPLPLEYMPTGGDSGGGAFIQKNGRWLLAGVVSYGHQTGSAETGWYGSTGFLTRVACYVDWIAENLR
jgi:hypothetical protein